MTHLDEAIRHVEENTVSGYVTAIEMACDQLRDYLPDRRNIEDRELRSIFEMRDRDLLLGAIGTPGLDTLKYRKITTGIIVHRLQDSTTIAMMSELSAEESAWLRDFAISTIQRIKEAHDALV